MMMKMLGLLRLRCPSIYSSHRFSRPPIQQAIFGIGIATSRFSSVLGRRSYPPTGLAAGSLFFCFPRSQHRGEMGDLEAPTFGKTRVVVKKVLANEQQEGDGASVRRSIGSGELRNLDPFLMLDEFSVRAPAGFPDHPHRGFETVTYMLEGGFTHQDFAGHKGTIMAGDLQWMTAGRGIVHSEMPATGGENKGLQLWINLSSKDKMMEPRYQELQSKDIARVEEDGVDVRIIAGESFGVRSPVYTQTPTMYLDFTLKPGAEVHQLIPETWNAFVYIIDGEGIFGDPNSPPATSHHVLVLSPGDGLSVWNRSAAPLRFVLIGGQPLNEPIVQHGPFVMNTRAEIQKAMEDYYYCRNGFENARQWRSQKQLH